MDETTTKILEALDALPVARRREVLDYVESLRKQEERRTENGEQDPEDDPILDAIGSISHGTLAQNIDKDLYGS